MAVRPNPGTPSQVRHEGADALRYAHKHAGGRVVDYTTSFDPADVRGMASEQRSTVRHG